MKALFKLQVVLLIASVAFAAGLSPSAKADTTYTYTGNPFTTFTGGPVCSGGSGDCSVSGSLTFLSPLPDKCDGCKLPAPVNFSFTDGKWVGTPGSWEIGNLVFITDASGNIIGWGIAICDVGGVIGCIGTIGAPMNSFDSFIRDPVMFADNMGNPGTWSVATSVVPTPEPSSLLLLTSGLAGLGLLRRRFLHA